MKGSSAPGMMTVALGAVVNIVLDPIFIFVFRMGVRGAAAATVLSQAVSALWVLLYLTRSSTPVPLRAQEIRLTRQEWYRLYLAAGNPLP